MSMHRRVTKAEGWEVSLESEKNVFLEKNDSKLSEFIFNQKKWQRVFSHINTYEIHMCTDGRWAKSWHFQEAYNASRRAVT